MFSKNIIIFVSLILLITITNVQLETNNDCSTLLSYYNLYLSKNCFFNPDVDLNTTELLSAHFGNYETYKVQTDDGYILTLFRISNRKPRGVVVLYHPMTIDSTIWIGQNNESLAVKLYNLGYEVWLPNTRGTLYSEKHVNLTIDDPKYWEFSFHEVGLYDLDAITKLIQKKTNRSDFIAIGESFSSSALVAYSALRADASRKAYKLLIHLSTIGYLNNIPLPLRIIAKFTNPLKQFFDLINFRSVFRSDSIVTKVMSFIGRYSPTGKLIINFIIKLGFGFSKGGVDPKLYNLLFSNYPRAISMKGLAHYGQISSAGKFQMYDFGKDQNNKIYGQSQPLTYPLANMSTPMYFVYSDADALSTTKDTKHLISELPKGLVIGEHQAVDINHVEYFYGVRRFELVLNKLIKLITDTL